MEQAMAEKKIAADGKTELELPTTTEFAVSKTSQSKTTKENKIGKNFQDIFKMGYPEEDVKRALRASFNNAERAIQYLVNGVPQSPSTPEGNSSDSDTSDSSEISLFDPVFRRLRQSIKQPPQFLDMAIKRMGKLYPQILRHVNDNHKEFVSMLFEVSDDEEGNSEEADGSEPEEEKEDDDDDDINSDEEDEDEGIEDLKD